MNAAPLLIEVKSIIGHAVCTMRADHSTASEQESALDNLAAAMYAIEDYLSNQGSHHDALQANDSNLQQSSSSSSILQT